MKLGESLSATSPAGVDDRLRRLVESTNVIPWEADPSTWLFTYVGPQAERLLGYPIEEWYREDFWVEHIHPDDRHYAMDFCLTSSKRRRDYEFDYRMLASDGRVVWLHDVVHVETDDGEPRRLTGFMIDVTERYRAREALRTLSSRLIEAQEEERGRIARELHDDVSQRLALLAVELDVIGRPSLSARVKELSSDLHAISRRLHPRSVEKLGLSIALRSLCREIGQHGRVRIEFAERDVPDSIPNDKALCLYRVAQECLQNVIKHSRAEEATVELSGRGDAIRLRVSDAGVGFEPDAVSRREGLGIDSMRERLYAVGGELSIESNPARGTRIEATVAAR